MKDLTLTNLKTQTPQLKWNRTTIATINIITAIIFLIILNPFAPHLSEEIFEILGYNSDGPISDQKWPEYIAKYLETENMKIVAGDLLREGFSEEAKLAYEMIDDMTTSITTASQKFDLDAQASMLQKLFITEHGSLDTVENLKKFKKQLDQAGLGNTTLYGRVSADLRTLRGEEEKISKETRTSLKDLSEQMTKYNIPTMEKNLIVMENLIKEFPDNLPGINILEQYDPTEPAKRVQSAYAKLRNIVLKERSGAAVTVPEFERLKEEIRGATFVTDKDIIRWVGTIRDAVEANKKGILAGYTQDVRDLYVKGGGVSITNNEISPELQAIIDKYK